MEPAHLRYFREVAAHGSARHAAERLFVAQSAVSRQIALLESELGVHLFDRHAQAIPGGAASGAAFERAHEIERFRDAQSVPIRRPRKRARPRARMKPESTFY